MLLIDPMHIFFLGTAKHFARDIRIGRKILTSIELSKVEEKLSRAIASAGLGRLPISIDFGHF